MTSTTYALHRRPRIERHVLAILRGEGRDMAEEARACFARLKSLADARGLRILAPGTRFASAAELTLLGWLADAQRLVATGSAPDDPDFLETIRRCGQALTQMNLHLPPLSLHVQPRLSRV